MAEDAPDTRQVMGWLWDNKDWILRRIKDLREWFRGKKKGDGKPAGILILGPGGVGKTTLARLLSGDFDLLLDGLD